MIKSIFWDIDETLIHSQVNCDPHQECLKYELDGDRNNYYTIVRPCAIDVIKFSRDFVGHENVFILTTSSKDYALKINQLAGFGFPEENILTRETLKKHHFSTAYGGSATVPMKGIAHKDNILIDNLPWNSNFSKMELIGITRDRYLHVRDYYGVNYPDDVFEIRVREFIDEKYNEHE